jgi:hypothetical protein
LVVLALLAGCASRPDFASPEAAIRIWDDGHIFWSGAFKRVDYQKFLDRGLRPEDVKDLRIRNSPGGELSVVTRLRALVADYDVPVRVDGQCASGCALIYVAAKRHVMLDDPGEQRTYLHFHGSYNVQTGAVIEKFDERELVVLERTTHGRFPPALYKQARLVADPRGGLYVYKYTYDGEDNGPSVFLCTGLETSIPRRCKVLPMTAVSLGLDE